ncbi:hypothetical protein SASPL_127853 [Salvia splendens]|uniref:PH domain-containing protein n=1 Tax=Salvia splendens TaxID=180675 RepID=A0A8X8ZM74_SALSN|nr:hypothetical protein SASPL_127853 [Salvia splendens]
MGDGPRGIQILPDYFAASTSGSGSPSTPSQASSSATELRSQSLTSSRRRLKSARSMLNLFNLRGRLSWKLGANGEEKVVLSAVEVESLRSEIADLEERESHFKAQLEHIDEILRSARLSGYLYMRMRWAALPGEQPPIDDTEVDDWLPRFIVLHGSCIYLYMKATACLLNWEFLTRLFSKWTMEPVFCTSGAVWLAINIWAYISSYDLSPQDSTLLPDVIEVGRLPCLTLEDEATRYCFYILTRHGLRYECSSKSKIQSLFYPYALDLQVDSWLEALQIDCKLALDPDDLNEPKV